MCHEYTANGGPRASSSARLADDELPDFLAEDDAAEVDLLTDGGE